MPRASLFMRCRNGFSMRPGNGRFSSLAKACPLSEGCCQQPALSLAWGKGLARGSSASPPGGCSFHAKPRAKRVAYTRAEGPCRGQASLCGAGMDFSMRPGNGRFSLPGESLPAFRRLLPAARFALVWDKGLAARHSAGPPGGCSFPCKAARKARGIHKGQKGHAAGKPLYAVPEWIFHAARKRAVFLPGESLPAFRRLLPAARFAPCLG